jgi:prepilin-type processing-associated H-X9-DG protein
MKFTRYFIAAAVLAGAVAPAYAHHSFAMFDGTKTITMTGTLKELEWSNPHAWIRIEVADAATGQGQEWSFEMGSPGQLGSKGMKPDSIKPGDKIVIKAHPMKDGSHGGQFMTVAFADGRAVAGMVAR